MKIDASELENWNFRIARSEADEVFSADCMYLESDHAQTSTAAREKGADATDHTRVLGSGIYVATLRRAFIHIDDDEQR